METIQRHVEGGVANYGPGCVLSSFYLKPSVRVTGGLSVKADTNSILVHWRISTHDGADNVKTLLEGFGPLRFFKKASSAFRRHSRSGYWSNAAGFYQAEHALAAIQYFSGVPHVEATVLYTVYFTVSKDLADAALLEVDDIVSQVSQNIETAWDDRGTGTTVLRISGPNRERIVDLKRILEAILSGTVASSVGYKRPHREIWHHFFATAQGDVWLKHLRRDTAVFVVSDRQQCRLRIYDPDPDDERGSILIRLTQSKLAEKVEELKESHQTTIDLDRDSLRKLIASDAVVKLQKLLGHKKVSLDIIKKKLVLHCPKHAAWMATYQLNLPLPAPDESVSLQTCPVCGDETSDVRLSCGHVSCHECFDHQLYVASIDLTSRHFPVRCWHENCRKGISIADLRAYATGTMVDCLLKASLTYFVRSRPDEYRNCRRPDCESIYRRNSSYEVFTCPTCLTQTCTACHGPTHVGWTCAAYQERVKKDAVNERLLDDYKATSGTKDCPKCGTLISKIDGCNHMECSACHAHICWSCLKFFFRSDKCYEHMNLVHGGDGLEVEAGENDWSDVSEDELEDEDDNDDDDLEDQDDFWFW